MPGELDKNIRKAIKGLKVSDISKVKKISGMDPKLQALAEEILKVSPRVQKKEMGGEVMDMTKSEPVNMMDGGPVKKMNMGGVIGGRGGKFKGMR